MRAPVPLSFCRADANTIVSLRVERERNVESRARREQGMLRVMSVVMVLLACAAVAWAAPEVEIKAYGFRTNVFYIDVGVSDLGELAGQPLSGIGVGCTLTGSGIGHLQTNAPAMRLTGPQWAAEVAPETFAWASFDEMSNATSFGDVDDLTTFGILDVDLTPGPVSVGELVCRFLYAWDNIELGDNTIVRIHISGEEGETQPYLFDQNLDPVYATVRNNDMVAPEPATLGLLAAGLAVLLGRRRPKRR